jgi:hypothetical protein
VKISGGFWLIQHLFDPEANGTGGHFPLEFIANPMAEHRGTNWSNDGDSVVFNEFGGSGCPLASGVPSERCFENT